LNNYFNHQVKYWNGESLFSLSYNLIGEEPLSIRIQGKPYSVLMRTPGDEIAHAAGFCLGEGIIDNPADIASIAFCNGSDTNVVKVTLKPSGEEKISGHLDRRGYISQTGSWLCGKEMVKELYQMIQPMPDNADKTEIKAALNCLENLSQHQPLHSITRSSHAAAIYDSDYKILSAAEDVGRHNALDKAIGKIFLEHKLEQAHILTLSSRISYELVQKAARARIPVIFAVSRPTALAVELASELNMTLACFAKEGGLFVFCGEHRLV